MKLFRKVIIAVGLVLSVNACYEAVQQGPAPEVRYVYVYPYNRLNCFDYCGYYSYPYTYGYTPYYRPFIAHPYGPERPIHPEPPRQPSRPVEPPHHSEPPRPAK